MSFVVHNRVLAYLTINKTAGRTGVPENAHAAAGSLAAGLGKQQGVPTLKGRLELAYVFCYGCHCRSMNVYGRLDGNAGRC